MTNNKWCKENEDSFSLLLAEPGASDIPPLADTDVALLDIHDVICLHQT